MSADFTLAVMAYTDEAVAGKLAMLVLKVHIVQGQFALCQPWSYFSVLVEQRS